MAIHGMNAPIACAGHVGLDQASNATNRQDNPARRAIKSARKEDRP
jgi:hypothetical protein